MKRALLMMFELLGTSSSQIRIGKPDVGSMGPLAGQRCSQCFISKNLTVFAHVFAAGEIPTPSDFSQQEGHRTQMRFD